RRSMSSSRSERSSPNPPSDLRFSGTTARLPRNSHVHHPNHLPRSDRMEAPPTVYFLVSAVFHYLGPSFAVLLFARVHVLGVAALRIASAAVILAAWRRPWRGIAHLPNDSRRLLYTWGAVLAVMNACFYEAISRLPLGTVAAIEFLPVIGLATLGARTPRNAG